MNMSYQSLFILVQEVEEFAGDGDARGQRCVFVRVEGMLGGL